MFDKGAFRSWPLVLAGATVLASLFVAAALLGQVVSGGSLRLTGTVAGLAGAAFAGYVAVALLLRREHTS